MRYTILLAALVAAGCGDGKPTAVKATGKVMFKKTTPAAGALVVFHPADPVREKEIGGKPFAKVREDGTFSLTTYQEGDGAPEGDYGVTVDWRATSAAKFAVTSEGGEAGRSLLRPQFGDPARPAFKVTVKKGTANDFTFDVD